MSSQCLPANEAALLTQNGPLTVNKLLSEELGELEEELEITVGATGGFHADVATTLIPQLSGSTSRRSRRGLKTSHQTPSGGSVDVELLLVDDSTKGKAMNWSSLFALIPILHNISLNFSSQFGAF